MRTEQLCVAEVYQSQCQDLTPLKPGYVPFITTYMLLVIPIR